MLIQLPRAAQAFASDVNNDNQLSWDEFSYWAEYQPQFSVWLQRLGIACLEAISPLEDRNVQHSGQRPVQSTYRVRRKFPLGTQFDKLRVGQVRNIFMSYSTYGKLGPEQFATCLNELHVHSPHTVRRLFTLFDRDVSGDVMMREFASGFFLLCGGSYREKLNEAFNLFDLVCGRRRVVSAAPRCRAANADRPARRAPFRSAITKAITLLSDRSPPFCRTGTATCTR